LIKIKRHEKPLVVYPALSVTKGIAILHSFILVRA